jgi:hypothetical protein
MSTNTIMYSWKRTLPGREKLSAAHFEDFVDYLGRLQKDGQIQSFEPVLFDPNAGITGFFLIRADDARLNALIGSEQWSDHMIRSMMHLEEPALVRGVSGAMVTERMRRWAAQIPPQA